jgi:hypothetical protein
MAGFSREVAMLIDIILIREDHVILRDVDGSEVSLTAEDAEYVQTWLYVNRRKLHEMAQRQKQEGKSNWNTVMKTRLDRAEKRLQERKNEQSQ